MPFSTARFRPSAIFDAAKYNPLKKNGPSPESELSSATRNISKKMVESAAIQGVVMQRQSAPGRSGPSDASGRVKRRKP